MRWKKNPNRGKARTKKRFLFKPLKIDEVTRWLEFASWIEKWEWDNSIDRFYWRKVRWND